MQVHKAGTLPYLAPEVFSISRTIFYGTALDIWAFDMLLLEMFEGTGEILTLALASQSLSLFMFSHISTAEKEIVKSRPYQTFISSSETLKRQI
jgi:serine/threonine protein kinase